MPTPASLILKVQLFGDSLAQGLEIKEQGMWFNGDLHKAPEQRGLASILTEQSQLYSTIFNHLLSKSKDASKYFNHLVIENNNFARSGLCYAHYNPTLDRAKVPHQMNLEYISEVLRDVQSDLVIYSLGVNDTQDFNSAAVEQYLRLLMNNSESENSFFKSIEGHELASKLQGAFDKLKAGNMYTSIIPDYSMSKEENQKVLQMAKNVPGLNSKCLDYLKSWEERFFYSKNTKELVDAVDRVIQAYQDNQCLSERGYPLATAMILPPVLTKDCVYPIYHNTKSTLPELREALSAYANDKHFSTLDLEAIRAHTVGEAFAGDNIHLTKDFYSQAARELDFASLINLSVKAKADAIFKASTVGTEVIFSQVPEYVAAKEELDVISDKSLALVKELLASSSVSLESILEAPDMAGSRKKSGMSGI